MRMRNTSICSLPCILSLLMHFFLVVNVGTGVLLHKLAHLYGPSVCTELHGALRRVRYHSQHAVLNRFNIGVNV